MPLEWEGVRRSSVALRALASVQQYAAETIVVRGDAEGERLGDDATLDELLAEFGAALLRELDAQVAITARQQ